MHYAAALARWYGANLIGLYAHAPLFVTVPAFEFAGYPTASGVAPQPADLTTFRDDLRNLMRDVATNVPSDVLVKTGDPTREILTAARALPADLIVMGTHGHGGFEHLLLGSVTEKVLRKAICPVLTVPPGAPAAAVMPFQQILCPVDFSDLSPAIVEFAGSIARHDRSRVTLLHVLEWPPNDEEPLSTRHFSVPEYRRFRESDAAARMTTLIAQGLEHAMVATRFAYGKPYREILAVAADEHADAIVMGVHGRNVMDLMMFGSTTNQVVRRATCPVLTLRQ
jgi:nucleotide-binding universal stress UspA family protein